MKTIKNYQRAIEALSVLCLFALANSSFAAPSVNCKPVVVPNTCTAGTGGWYDEWPKGYGCSNGATISISGTSGDCTFRPLPGTADTYAQIASFDPQTVYYCGNSSDKIQGSWTTTTELINGSYTSTITCSLNTNSESKLDSKK